MLELTEHVAVEDTETFEELIAHGRLHAAHGHGRTAQEMTAVDVAVGAAIRDVG